jgi:hypothetical protein
LRQAEPPEALDETGVGSVVVLRHVVTSMFGTRLRLKPVLKMSLMSLMMQLTGSSLRLQFSSFDRSALASELC